MERGSRRAPAPQEAAVDRQQRRCNERHSAELLHADRLVQDRDPSRMALGGIINVTSITLLPPARLTMAKKMR